MYGQSHDFDRLLALRSVSDARTASHVDSYRPRRGRRIDATLDRQDVNGRKSSSYDTDRDVLSDGDLRDEVGVLRAGMSQRTRRPYRSNSYARSRARRLPEKPPT